MRLQLILILTLVAQQIGLPIAIAGANGAGCAAPSCCVIVTKTGCCGEVVVETECVEADGACRCDLEPGDSDTDPKAPHPQRNWRHAGPLFATSAIGQVFNLPQRALTWSRAMQPAPNSTHNETQALLCVWRR